jgi:hypothetical protein
MAELLCQVSQASQVSLDPSPHMVAQLGQVSKGLLSLQQFHQYLRQVLHLLLLATLLAVAPLEPCLMSFSARWRQGADR